MAERIISTCLLFFLASFLSVFSRSGFIFKLAVFAYPPEKVKQDEDWEFDNIIKSIYILSYIDRLII